MINLKMFNFSFLICFKGYRPILDAMKSFAADASPIDIEVCCSSDELFALFCSDAQNIS